MSDERADQPIDGRGEALPNRLKASLVALTTIDWMQIVPKRTRADFWSDLNQFTGVTHPNFERFQPGCSCLRYDLQADTVLHCAGMGFCIDGDGNEFRCELAEASEGCSDFFSEVQRQYARPAQIRFSDEDVPVAWRRMPFFDPATPASRAMSVAERVTEIVDHEEHLRHAHHQHLGRLEGYNRARTLTMQYFVILMLVLGIDAADAFSVGPVTVEVSYDWVTDTAAWVEASARGSVPVALSQVDALMASPACSFDHSFNATHVGYYNHRCEKALVQDEWLRVAVWAYAAIAALLVFLSFTFAAFVLLRLVFRASASVLTAFLEMVSRYRAWRRNSRIVSLMSHTPITIGKQQDKSRWMPFDFSGFKETPKEVDVSLGELEMAIKGSEIRVASYTEGMVYLASIAGKDVTFVGMAFRYENYLVTVAHNKLALTSAPGKYYAIPFEPTDGGESSTLALGSVVDITELVSRDIVPECAEYLDACIIPVPDPVWAKMKIKSLKATDACWGNNVTLYGLEKSGQHKLQRSIGTIQPPKNKTDEPLHNIYYTASTLKGWSGSPVLSSHRKVLGIHCGTDGHINRGLNFAYVRLIIDAFNAAGLESPIPLPEAFRHMPRSRRGELSDREDDVELNFDYDDSDDRLYRFKAYRSSRGAVSFSTREWHEENNRPGRQRGVALEYDGEGELECHVVQQPLKVDTHHSEPAPIPGTLTLPVTPPRKEQPLDFSSMGHFSVASGPKVSCPYVRDQAGSSEGLRLDEAEKLGYVSGKFVMPPANDRQTAIDRSKISLAKSLKDACDIRDNFPRPSADLRSTVKKLMLKMLAKNKYVADVSGVTKEKLECLINSTALKDSKCPGMPYVAEGIVNNAQLRSKYSSSELAEKVLASFEDGSWKHPSVNVLKIEATKVEKIEAGLDRCVQMFSAEAQLIFRCLMGSMIDQAVEAYRASPVMAGWSPLKQGDGEWLYKQIDRRGRKVLEYDHQGHEFTAHTEEAYADVTDVEIALAVKPAGCTDEAFNKWKDTCRSFNAEVGKVGYLFGDGTVVNKHHPFVLASGRFDTFYRNSLTTLYWAILGLLEMGYSPEDVVAKTSLHVGGDDILGTVPSNFDLPKFMTCIRRYGLRLHKEGLHDISEGYEFFSWHFKKSPYGQIVWLPTRFAKHVENLRYTKVSDRPSALVSHMMNWAHSEPHYNYFHTLFMDGHVTDQQAYDISLVPDRQDYLCHLRGDEGLVRNPYHPALAYKPDLDCFGDGIVA